jgi:hypothetical protein
LRHQTQFSLPQWGGESNVAGVFVMNALPQKRHGQHREEGEKRSGRAKNPKK